MTENIKKRSDLDIQQENKILDEQYEKMGKDKEYLEELSNNAESYLSV